MGAQGKPWSQAPFHGAHNTLYLCWRVCHSLELWFHTVGLLHTMLYLYPSCDGIPTVNSCHLIQAADKKKKTRSTPKSSWNCCMQNPTVYPKQTAFYHNTLILCSSNPSAGSPHPGGFTATERLLNKQKAKRQRKTTDHARTDQQERKLCILRERIIIRRIIICHITTTFIHVFH